MVNVIFATDTKVVIVYATRKSEERCKYIRAGLTAAPSPPVSPDLHVAYSTFSLADKENPDSDIKSRFGSETGELKYGITKVSICRDHRIGELESPSIWKLEFREDLGKHVVLLTLQAFEKPVF